MGSATLAPLLALTAVPAARLGYRSGDTRLLSAWPQRRRRIYSTYVVIFTDSSPILSSKRRWRFLADGRV